ncbi:MAG: alpha/beta hydrolase [Bacteroidota bacterium]
MPVSTYLCSVHYRFFSHQNGKIAYRKFGAGEELLIAIHGFGDRSSLFDVLEDGLGKKYTVYAFDLPYHGQTEWNKEYFDKVDVLSFIELVLEQEQRQEFALMGYSMGGRIIQILLPKIISQVTDLYLIAPDGIETKWMFNFNILPPFVRRVFQRLLQNPERFFKIIGWIYERKFVTKFIHDFAYNHLKTANRRHRLFCTWNALHHFKTKPKKFKKLLRAHQLSTNLYYGKRDEVIRASSGEWLKAGLLNVQLYLLDEGHLLIGEKLNQLLHQQLNKHTISSNI